MTRNSNRTWEMTFADGATFTRTCRNSLGSFAKMVQPLEAEHGTLAAWQEVQTF